MTCVLGLWRLMRPTHWLKNGFVWAPLFFCPEAMHVAQVGRVLVGFVCFCMLASSIYIVNDFLDRHRDQCHPIKKHRPFAAETVSPLAGGALAMLLASVACVVAWRLSPHFLWILISYGCLNIVYGVWLKHVALIDIACVAFGFVLRVMAGAALIQVVPSLWLLVCTGLLALFLVIAKRRDDVVCGCDVHHRPSLSGYNLALTDAMMIITVAALLMVYIGYTMDVATLYHFHSTLVYWTIPMVILGLFRYLQITFVEQRSGAPTQLCCQDNFLRWVMVLWGVLWGWIVYHPYF